MNSGARLVFRVKKRRSDSEMIINSRENRNQMAKEEKLQHAGPELRMMSACPRSANTGLGYQQRTLELPLEKVCVWVKFKKAESFPPGDKSQKITCNGNANKIVMQRYFMGFTDGHSHLYGKYIVEILVNMYPGWFDENENWILIPSLLFPMPPGLSVCLGLFLSHVPTLRWFFALLPPPQKNLSA